MQNDIDRSIIPGAPPRDPLGRPVGDEVFNPSPGDVTIESGRTGLDDNDIEMGDERNPGGGPPSM